MDNRVVALFSIALLGGLGGGYVLSYAIFQPRVLVIESDIAKMQSELSSLSTCQSALNSTYYKLKENYEAFNTTIRKTIKTIQESISSENYIRTIEFVESTEIEVNGDVVDVATFVWTPESVNVNAILSVTFYAEYTPLPYDPWGNGTNPGCYLNLNTLVNDTSIVSGSVLTHYPGYADYKWTSKRTSQALQVTPNRSSYVIKVKANTSGFSGYPGPPYSPGGLALVRNIHVILLVIDG